jgi:hypothetical protein
MGNIFSRGQSLRAVLLHLSKIFHTSRSNFGLFVFPFMTHILASNPLFENYIRNSLSDEKTTENLINEIERIKKLNIVWIYWWEILLNDWFVQECLRLVIGNQDLLKYPDLWQRIKTRKNPIDAVSSEYEQNVGSLIAEKLEKLESMRNSSHANQIELHTLNLELELLENLYDNYNLGMNYFRRAKGGRKGLRE